MFSIGASYAVTYDRVIKGQSGTWTMHINNPWMGGSLNQIRYILSQATQPSMIKIFRALEKLAYSTDAVIISLESGNELPGHLFVDHGASYLPLSAFDNPKFSSVGAKIMESRLPGTGKCYYERRELVKTAGYPSLKGYFNCQIYGYGNMKSIYLQIERPNDHLSVMLYVDEKVKLQRMLEFNSMLNSLRFTK